MSPDDNKTREPPGKLATLRQQVAEFEVLESGLEWAEETPRESEEKYRLLIDGSSNPVTVYDSDGTLLLMNTAAAKALGGTPDDFIGKSICEVHPGIADMAMERIHQVVESGESREFETIMELPVGWRWFWSTFQPVRDTSGDVKAVQIISYDITERKQAEEALRESEEKYKELAESITDVFFAMNEELRYTYWNKASEELTGTSAKYALGKHLYDLFPDNEATRKAEEMYREVLRMKKPRHFVNEYQLGGKDYFFEISAYPVEGGLSVFVKDITERKQAQETLKESERKYRTLFESTLDGAFVIDAETMQVVLANQAAAKMYGFEPAEDVVGVNPLDLVPLEERERVSRIITEDMFDKDRRQVNEFQTITRDGRETWISARGVRTEYQGRPAGLVSFRDVTERKRAEEALRESGEKYRELADFLPQTVFESDEIGNLTFINRHGFQAFGYTPEDFHKGLSALQMYIPEERSRVLENVLRVLTGKTTGGSEYTALRRDGSTFPAIVYSAPIIRGGRPVGLRGIIIDNTERKQAEEALKEAEERYRTLLNLGAEVGEAIVMLQDTEQGDAIHTFVSGDWPRITGYSRKQLLGMSFFDLLHPEDRKASLERHRKKMGGAVMPGLFEMAVIRKDGTEVPIEVTSAYTTYKGQGANVAFIRDISERRQAEKREEEMQQELSLSSRLAAVGELAAGVAHEINNPLTGVLGFSQRLMRKSTDEETSRDLERIHNEAQRAAKVVDNLLTFARRREPKKEYLDINEIVARTLELRAYELRTGSIDVVVELAPSLPKVLADFQQIQQVFVNIILNAEQVMIKTNNGGKLSVKTQQAKACIRISFADDGPGIGSEDLDKLFDPFFTTKGEEGGTGLGLSVCHGIVTEHGGRIYAKSKLKQGATFFIELPLAANQLDG